MEFIKNVLDYFTCSDLLAPRFCQIANNLTEIFDQELTKQKLNVGECRKQLELTSRVFVKQVLHFFRYLEINVVHVVQSHIQHENSDLTNQLLFLVFCIDGLIRK